MPKRIMVGQHVTDISLYRYLKDSVISTPGVGPCPWFGASGDPGHKTVEAAMEQWARVRRDVWGFEFRFHVPPAAVAYDGFRCAAWEYMLTYRTLNTRFDGATALEAVAGDLAAVAEFESNDPEGAESIADYLRLWRDDLNTVRQCAQECGRYADDGVPRRHREETGM